MGCGHSSGDQLIYSKEYLFDKADACFVNPKTENFEDIEKKCKNKTFFYILQKNFEKYKDHNCLGYRKIIAENQFEETFTFFSWGQTKTMSENFIYNLRANNLIQSHDFGADEGIHKFIGIYSKNCVEWLVSDFACQHDSVTVVTLYNTLGELAFEHIFNQTCLTTICISPENIKAILKFKEKYGLKTLKNVILFDLTNKLKKEDVEPLMKAGLNSFYFSELIKTVSEDVRLLCNLISPTPESIATISYTSGTTNLPKGAKISQRSIASQMTTFNDSGANLTSSDLHFSYLPLAHIMERIGTALILSTGGSIGFISGDVRTTLADDLKFLHPTFFFAVPKVLANFRDKIMDKISTITGCKRSLIERALRVKREKFMEKGEITDVFYDSFVLNKIHAEFGGKWRFIITGSAPLAIDLGIDIKMIFSCPIIEGYGMTELGGACHCTHFSDTINGFVGGPVSTAKVKLVDVPELNYTKNTMTNGVKTPCGEICVKGPLVFSGYFCDKENTNKMIDKDGWVHTGDVGMVSTDQVKFKVIDRIKEIFKLVQGEYIAPSKLEMIYSKSEYISQICIYGQSVKTYIIAILTVKKPEVTRFLKEKNILKDGEKVEDHYENKDLLDEIKRSLDKLASANNFNSLEKVSKIIISKVEFTIDNELLTPTAKLVRRKIELMYKAEIDKIYI